MLELREIKKDYPAGSETVHALKGVDLQFRKNEFVSILGPSGCGKSTILSILCGLEEKSGGEILFKENSNIGYMLQQDSLFEWRNILNNCLLGLEINNNLNDDTRKRVINLLEDYGLKDFIYSYPDNLSGGMRQRVLRIRYTHK